MAKRPEPHPILLTTRLRLRQFRAEDTDAMHECFADPEAMRFLERTSPHQAHRDRAHRAQICRLHPVLPSALGGRRH
ncbi:MULTISPECIES: GNAT family N-acetyltransferase [unclassified Mesorhizobium]|uniref:GNAT family N-acetyltransferase n=1 Tax=unclassified Mesorhizobium TaxID=325217 RepID=UPI0032AEE680